MDGAKRKVLARLRGEENAYSETAAPASRAAGKSLQGRQQRKPRRTPLVPAAAMRSGRHSFDSEAA